MIHPVKLAVRRVRDDDRAANSVLGTILLAALTVVVATGVAVAALTIASGEMDTISRGVEQVFGW